MDNPWLELTGTYPYVLDSDILDIVAFNEKAKESNQYHLELIPEHYIGNKDAPVVLLGLNPGYHPTDRWWSLRDDLFIKSALDNLGHKKSDLPFYLLNPDFASSRGYDWWNNKKLRPLIEASSLEKVANNVFDIEFYPYHSEEFSKKTPYVPSQEYGFDLVRKAIERDAKIIVTRSLNRWLAAVPELKKYYTTKNPRTVISYNNLNEFDEIVDIINNS